ncbi:type IV secretory system conjugative DNA transfer family protein [Nocardia blacklockiae]|uniref:type IV secretory system conjugative DNA transfer family protein n=1 Tax=Nocardia blacklockiae TaxID=480036 RepID=UPI00189572F4|nr:type IV secretory system conjugative DNA transfer family protein [Nocardia blacklockiae]MBF6171288.1 type IV secretory system conjugative DNA transfer family protein [Nocardia blacklockiae]
MTTDQQALPLTADSLVWQQVFWPAPFPEAAAFSILRHWAAQTHAPQLILETRAESGGVEYLIGSRLRHAQGVRAAIEQLVKGSVMVGYPDDREPITVARKLKLSSVRPIEPHDAVASTRSILHALTTVRSGERLVIQQVLGPRWHPHSVPTEPLRYDQSVISRVLRGALPEDRADVRQAIAQKVGQHGFITTLRIGVHAGGAERRRSLLLGLAAAMNTVEAPGVRLTLRPEQPAKLNRPRTTWSLFARAQQLSVVETARLIAWPINDRDHDEPFPGQPPRHPKPVRPSTAVLAGERVIANANAPGVTGAFGYSVVDATRHLWTMGPSGVGKSSLFLNLIVDDLEKNRPVVVIEPKDLVADILERIPAHRIDDVVVLDPLSDSPIGINPLDGKHRGGRTPQVVADSLFSMFRSIYGDSLGHRSADILRNCLEVLARREDASLVMLPLLLNNPGFRRSLTQHIIREDPYAAGPFWQWYDGLSPEAVASITAPLSNKLRPLMTKQLRAVLAQRNPKFNIRQVLTERKVLLVPLQKGVIGPEAAQLLSAAVLYELWQAILERAGTPEQSREPVMIFVDEIQEFLRFSDDLSEALALARSLRAGFHFAHQHEAQLPKSMLEALRNNARSKVFFQLQPGDAKNAAVGQSTVAAEDFSSLPAFHVYASLIRDNGVQPWISGVTLPPPPKTSDPEEVRRRSRKRYGQPLDEIEAGFADLVAGVDGTGRAADVNHGRKARRS